MNKIKVVIPLKTNSTRVPFKNLKPFFGSDSLFDIKIKQLLNTFEPEDIYVSSENIIVKEYCDKYHCNFCLRDSYFTRNDIPETDIVSGIIDSIGDKNSDILWCQVTQPLFNEYDKIINLYKNIYSDYDSLCVVQRFRHHLIDEHFNGVNFNFGYWHKVSQDLPKFYVLTWAAFIIKRDILEKCHYEIGRKPYLYNTESYLVDIDTEQDFKIAQIIYNFLKTN